jgi:hypothetical protein
LIIIIIIKSQMDGLQLQIDAALESVDLEGHIWPDLQVNLWPVVEYFDHKMQTDGYAFPIASLY